MTVSGDSSFFNAFFLMLTRIGILMWAFFNHNLTLQAYLIPWYPKVWEPHGI